MQVVQVMLWYLDSGCSKHMTGNRSKLMNFVEKFIGSVRFGNDHLGAIMGYGDYVMGDSVISRVYYVEGLGHNLFSVGQFCDSDLEVAFRKHTCFVRDLMGADSLKGKKYILVIVDDYSRFTWVKFLRSKDETPEFVTNFLKQIQPVNLEKARSSPTDQNSKQFIYGSSSYPLHGSVRPHESREHKGKKYILIIVDDIKIHMAARTMMIFSKAPMFLWAEAVATACYTQNRSLIHTRHNKTPYELVHEKKPDLTFFRVFGALCYLRNDSENLGKFQAKADIGIFVGARSNRQELEMLFQPMFDEHLEQSRVDEPVPSATEVNAQVVPPSTSLSTTIAQDAPSTSASSSTSDSHLPVQHQEIPEDTPIIHDVPHPSNNLVTGDPGSAQSSSGNWIYKEKLDEYGDCYEKQSSVSCKRFRRRKLQEEVFVSHLKDLKIRENPTHVRLSSEKALYGHMQDQGAWLKPLSSFLMANNFFKASRRPCLALACVLDYQAKPTKNTLKLSNCLSVLEEPFMGLWYQKDNDMSLTAYADANHAGCQELQEEVRRNSKTTDLTSTKFLCTVITKVLLLCAVTTSSTLALNTLTYDTTSSESKWKIEWLNSTFVEKNLSSCNMPHQSIAKRTVRISSSTPRHEELDPGNSQTSSSRRG
ncbi:integrase, catalytic region, zinc finger, CCHC-type containing protein [Tanacetum coccineum]